MQGGHYGGIGAFPLLCLHYATVPLNTFSLKFELSNFFPDESYECFEGHWGFKGHEGFEVFCE